MQFVCEAYPGDNDLRSAELDQALWTEGAIQERRLRRPSGPDAVPGEDEARAADELDLLPDGSAIAEMQNAYAVMREQARACADHKTRPASPHRFRRRESGPLSIRGHYRAAEYV